jgi:hypothetical protein
MIVVTAMAGGCAAKQQTVLPPLRIVHEAPPPAPAEPPPPTAAEILAAQPAEVREAVKKHEQKGEWPSYRTSYVLYAYGAGPQPVVDCAALRTTDVQLQPGETVTDLALGDQERWMATPASSGDPRSPVPHIVLKPQQPGIETNLTIYTTKHIYHLILRSRPRAMQEVEFYYPDELMSAMKEAAAAASKAEQERAQQIAVDDSRNERLQVVRVGQRLMGEGGIDHTGLMALTRLPRSLRSVVHVRAKSVGQLW